jgi:hypothetical protein
MTCLCIHQCVQFVHPAHVQVFKDIEAADVDMLLPGSVARFSWFDYAMIWAPVLFGLGEWSRRH